MRIILVMLMMLGITSCKSVNNSVVNSVDYTINDNILYYRGTEIGYLEAIKLQEKKGKIRREHVFVIKNDAQQIDKAYEIINYLKTHITKSDIELKTLYKK